MNDIRTGPATEDDTSPVRLLKLAVAAQTLAAGGYDPLYVGGNFRIVSIPNGAKIQVSADGVTWQDGPSYEAS